MTTKAVLPGFFPNGLWTEGIVESFWPAKK